MTEHINDLYIFQGLVRENKLKFSADDLVSMLQ